MLSLNHQVAQNVCPFEFFAWLWSAGFWAHEFRRPGRSRCRAPWIQATPSWQAARRPGLRRSVVRLRRLKDCFCAKSQVDGKPSWSTPSGATFDLFAQSPFLVNHPFPSIAFYHHRFSCWCDRQGMRNGIDPLLWCILLRDVRTSTFCQPMGFPY